MAAGNIYLPVMPARDLNGKRVSGAQLFFFSNGTSVPKSVYSDVGLTTPYSQPVVADVAGTFAPIYADTAELYSAVCYAPNGTMLPHGAWDQVQATTSAVISAAIIAQAAAEEAAADAQSAAADAIADATPALVAATVEAIGDDSALVEDAIVAFLEDQLAVGFKKGLGAPNDGIGDDGDDYYALDTGVFYFDKGNPLAGSWAGCATGTFASHVAPSISFPTGALFTLDTNQFDATSMVIPNTLVAAPDTNILPAANGRFDDTNYFSTSGFTVTQNADGSVDLPMGAGATFTPFTVTLPAGTYTIGASAKRIGGSDVSWNFGLTAISTSPTKTAGAAYSRQSYSFTLGAPTTVAIWVAGTVALGAGSITLKDASIVPGAVDIPPQAALGHCRMGRSRYDTLNSGIYSAGKINLGNGGFGLVQLPAVQSVSTWTITGTVKKLYTSTTGTVTRGDYQALLAIAGSQWVNLMAALEYPSGSMTGTFSTLLQESWELFPGVPQALLGREYFVFTWRYDGSSLDLFVNGIQFNSFPAGAAAAVNVKDLYLGMILAPNLTTSYGIAGTTAMWARALTDAECRTSYQASKLNAALGTAVAIAEPSNIVFADGDSITGSFAYSYPYKALPSLNATTQLAKRANTSLFLANLTARLPLLAKAIPPNKGGRKLGYTCLIGANDAGSIIADPVAYAARLATYLDAVKALGFDYVNVGTVLPRTQAVSVFAPYLAFDGPRATLNAIIRTWEGVHCDRVIDFAATTVGDNNDCTDATKYADGLHPTTASHTILAVPYVSVLLSQGF